MSIQRPLNQVKLTNVAVVRLKKKGKRFEIACYPNKVLSWRNGVEKDLDEVLQIHNVFLNVSKGIVASKKDLKNCFDEEDDDKIIKLILEKGEVQVSEKERKVDTERIFKDIASIIHTKCINKETKKPVPIAMIEDLLKDLHVSVSQTKNAKQQALALIPILQEKIPITRSEMRIRTVVPKRFGKQVKEMLESKANCMEEEEWTDVYEALVRVDPGIFREIDEQVRMCSKGEGWSEIVDVAVDDTNP